MQKQILNIKNLSVEYLSDEAVVKAVNGINLQLTAGETLGLVGETGAGKTTTALSILRLLPRKTGIIKSGSIEFEGVDLLTVSEEEMRRLRGDKIAMIFQDPMTSLNPTIPVGDQIAEMLQLHAASAEEKQRIDKRVDELLELVGIPPVRRNEYPHQFSGGMKQRIVIAIALACDPILLIADEPTTALDVTIQAQVLEMMRDLKEKMNTSLLLITHDLGVVAAMCDKVAVMYAGEIVEVGPIEDIFENPLHPYTIGLFQSIPDLERETDRLIPIEGLMPDPTNLPSGCKFHTRCPKCTADCRTRVPETAWTEGHGVKCLLCGKTPNGDEHIE